MPEQLAIQPFLTAAKDISVIVGAGIGAVWFLYARRHKRRVSFQVDASPMPLVPLPDHRGLEVRFLFDNEGDRQQELMRVVFQVDGVAGPLDGGVTTAHPIGSSWMSLGSFSLQSQAGAKVPRIRPGTHHVLAEMVGVPVSVTIVRVTAKLDHYATRDETPPSAPLAYPAHATIRRFFALPPITPGAA